MKFDRITMCDSETANNLVLNSNYENKRCIKFNIMLNDEPYEIIIWVLRRFYIIFICYKYDGFSVLHAYVNKQNVPSIKHLVCAIINILKQHGYKVTPLF